ncbi:hypothetical protein [Aurantiacibacter odishensis]|uniref:hypothetical protein n=1 Tax=Aurantiacibacter odishensis TaxID=1155476 RepID=UPI0013C40D63|nr:hypothetical protein [Aurantiacibacter odishensis]
MKNTTKAICWASAMLVIAAMSAFGWIAEDVSTTLLIVFPILAVTTLSNRGCSLVRRGEMR